MIDSLIREGKDEVNENIHVVLKRSDTTEHEKILETEKVH